MERYYKIVSEDHTGLSGIKTKEEAERLKSYLRRDKEWNIVSYVPAEFEKNI